MALARTHSVVVVLPAYNAATTVERTISDIPHDLVNEIVLVDDCSKDNTLEIARALAKSHPRLSETPEEGKSVCTIIAHDVNKGYGGNQKTCYDYALSQGADIVVMVHPDYQYDPTRITALCEPLITGEYQFMLGSRLMTWKDTRAGGMPLYKYAANRFLTTAENLITGRRLSEWHTGMRAYTREALEAIPYHSFSDDFVFDTQMLMAAVRNGYSIGEIPVEVRYFAEASSINFRRSTIYGIRTMYYTLEYGVERARQLIKYLFAGGAGYVVNLAIYSALITFFSVWYPAAAVVAVAAGLFTSFLLQKFWTFRAQTSSGNATRQALQYALLGVANIFIVTQLIVASVEWAHIGKIVSAVFANALVAVWSYFFYKYIIFRPRAVVSST